MISVYNFPRQRNIAHNTTIKCVLHSETNTITRLGPMNRVNYMTALCEKTSLLSKSHLNIPLEQ